VDLLKKGRRVKATADKPQEDEGQPSRYLRMPDVVKLTGLSASTIKRNVKRGTFPRPRRLSVQAVGWREADVHQWLTEREIVK
jgi:prophage regulatory protein